MNIRQTLLTSLLSITALAFCRADSTVLPEKVPDGWQYKCTMVVFTVDTMRSTTIDSSGRCSVMFNRIGESNYTSRVTTLSKQDVDDFYRIARETINTYNPTVQDLSKLNSASRKKALFNYITLTLRIGPNQKNGISSAVYASPPNFEICHFSRIIRKANTLSTPPMRSPFKKREKASERYKLPSVSPQPKPQHERAIELNQ